MLPAPAVPPAPAAAPLEDGEITTPEGVVAATGALTRGTLVAALEPEALAVAGDGPPAPAVAPAVAAGAGAVAGAEATVRAKSALAAPTPTTSAAIVQLETCRRRRRPVSRLLAASGPGTSGIRSSWSVCGSMGPQCAMGDVRDVSAS